MGEKIREEAIYSSYLETEEGKKQVYDYELGKVRNLDVSANFSPLTGLPVLRMFNILSTDIIQEHPELHYAVIMMDITQFKAVNEFLGRKEGDRLLRFIAGCLQECVEDRPYTVAGHCRADIFVLFTAYKERSELAAITMEIKSRIESLDFSYRVSISFGICASEDTQPSVSYLRDCANIALHEIKGKYYADYIFFEDQMRSKMLREKLVESEVIKALEDGRIVPYIQPKVDMQTGRIIGGEALARWLHPEQGVLPPNEFIPVIERTGFVINVDKYIWERIFAYQKSVMEEGRRLLPISVNVSRMHIHNTYLVRTLTSMREEYGIPAEYVPLEINEAAFSADHEAIMIRMSQLRDKGFPISMDDFGSGYSSLNMLKGSEMDEIKIDKEFLNHLDSEKSRIVIASLLDMMKRLHQRVIVEGVETEEQKEFLLENGCHMAQGFLFYKPMPLEEFDAMVREQEKNGSGL